jgi:hypothetical protein
LCVKSLTVIFLTSIYVIVYVHSHIPATIVEVLNHYGYTVIVSIYTDKRMISVSFRRTVFPPNSIHKYRHYGADQLPYIH